ALTRVVRFRVIAAAIVVLSIIGLVGVAGWAWSDDVEGLWQKLPGAAKAISRSLQDITQRQGSPVAEVKKAAAEVESITNDKNARQIHRYLGVLLVSNILVGMGTWIIFAFLGVEYPGLWGLAAGVLHTAPYFGPALVAGASLVAVFLQSGKWSIALMAAGGT